MSKESEILASFDAYKKACGVPSNLVLLAMNPEVGPAAKRSETRVDGVIGWILCNVEYGKKYPLSELQKQYHKFEEDVDWLRKLFSKDEFSLVIKRFWWRQYIGEIKADFTVHICYEVTDVNQESPLLYIGKRWTADLEGVCPFIEKKPEVFNFDEEFKKFLNHALYKMAGDGNIDEVQKTIKETAEKVLATAWVDKDAYSKGVRANSKK